MQSFPNRCQHLKINGTQCGSPALRRHRFCYFHKRFQDERIQLSADRARRGVATFELPILEDANSIQIALMQVMRLLVSGQLDHKTASLLLYALQTASTNLRMTKFFPNTNDVILDVRDVAETRLDAQIWNDEDFEDFESDEDDYEEDEEEEDRAAAIVAPKPAPKPAPPVQPVAKVTATGSAVLSPPAKKPVVNATTARDRDKEKDKDNVGQQVADHIRKDYFSRVSLPVTCRPGAESMRPASSVKYSRAVRDNRTCPTP